jgi:hypothetical protein
MLLRILSENNEEFDNLDGKGLYSGAMDTLTVGLDEELHKFLHETDQSMVAIRIDSLSYDMASQSHAVMSQPLYVVPLLASESPRSSPAGDGF